MKAHVRKVGNSQGVIIPKPLLDEIGLKAGDAVELKINKKGRLVMSPLRNAARAGWADDSRILAGAGEAGQAWPEPPARPKVA
jgi:antitoxin MazE